MIDYFLVQEPCPHCADGESRGCSDCAGTGRREVPLLGALVQLLLGVGCPISTGLAEELATLQDRDARAFADLPPEAPDNERLQELAEYAWRRATGAGQALEGPLIGPGILQKALAGQVSELAHALGTRELTPAGNRCRSRLRQLGQLLKLVPEVSELAEAARGQGVSLDQGLADLQELGTLVAGETALAATAWLSELGAEGKEPGAGEGGPHG